MSFISSILSKHIITTTVPVDNASEGQQVLHQALTQLQNRLEGDGRERVLMEVALMKQAVGDAVELAYLDFKAFSERWICRVGYHEHPEKSNVFVFYFKEKRPQGHDYQFRFAGLTGATTH